MRNHKPDPKLSAHRRAARVLLLVCTLAAYALPFTTPASAQARDAILFRAVTTGQVERVRDFLARGMDPESRDETHRSVARSSRFGRCRSRRAKEVT